VRTICVRPKTTRNITLIQEGKKKKRHRKQKEIARVSENAE